MARYRIKSVGMRGHVHLYEETRPLDDNTHVSLTQEFTTSRTDVVNGPRTRNMSFRGDRYIVAVPGTGTVEVHVIVRGEWTKVATLADPQLDNTSEFGATVGISGSFVVVGAPGANNGDGRVYLYENRNGGWRLCARPHLDLAGEPGARFGESLELDGTMLVVGAPLAMGGSGSASLRCGAAFSYLYDLQAKTWNDHAGVVSSTPQHNARFGASVSIDKELALAVGSPNQNVNQGATVVGAGNVQVFVRQGPSWAYQTTLVDATSNENEFFGSSISYRADRLLVGAPGMTGGGGAIMFVGSYEVWSVAQVFKVRATGTTIIDLNVGNTDAQGSCVDQDPTLNVVYLNSATSAGGRVYVFELTQAGNWKPANSPVLTASDGEPTYTFGGAVSAYGRALMITSQKSPSELALYRFR